MKKIFTLIFALTLVALFFSSCGKNAEPVKISGYDNYEDPAVKFSLKYPSNWVTNKTPGVRFLAFSSDAVKSRFGSYSPKGEAGAKLEIFIVDLNDTVKMEDVIKTVKAFSPETYTPVKNVTIDGVQASMQSFAFELEDGPFHGEIYYATKDNKKVTVVLFEAFAGTFEAYRKNIDEIIASMKLAAYQEPKAAEAAQPKEADPPSQTLTAKTGDGYTIEIPDNFRAEKGSKSGVISSRNYIGDRRADCNIQVDVMDASKSKSLDKIVDENRATYQNAQPKETTLGGEKAFVMNYSVGKGISSRVYFAKKGTRLIRMTVNWFKADESMYLPLFEKSIKSFKFL